MKEGNEMGKKTYREHSRSEWITADGRPDNPDKDGISLGCLQRIADATELMAKNHAQLVTEAARYKRWYEQEAITSKRLVRSNAALRGLLKKRKA